METCHHIWQVFAAAPALSVPLWQVLLFIVIVSLASIGERHRLILLFCYLFTFNWVFIENLRLLSLNQVSVVTVLVFAGFGLLTLILAVYHAVTTTHHA
ncbi:MAG: hypothetical protein WC708_16645 [Lentisphaeria bacterium]